jgi:hypothetical protein
VNLKIIKIVKIEHAELGKELESYSERNWRRTGKETGTGTGKRT